ncbi:osmotic signal transduction-like protein (plasmid) [Thermus parvatiensis]|uniref:Osmotic signal transduction-like protein n=1 Tax=Thermus parvatiensis TaxID=456163 RepID=A0A0X8DAD4_9DEIN|nr:YbjN domain-containing protein [Thermus parvatiensis]AMA76323.1 osmotic signal transduction-like protein [Thermus parvatiensis]
MEERMWIAEEEVSKARLEEICRMAGYTTSVDQDGDLVVHGDALKTLVIVSREKSIIHFACVFRFEPWVPEQDRLLFVNRLNDTTHVLRFSMKVQSPDILVVDYDLPFQGGVLESQIRFVLRLFHQRLPLLIALHGGAGLLR